MDIYQTLGPLILGSRLRRLSEQFISEVNKVYQEQGIHFDASWFPVFYLLSERPAISIRELSNALQVSHSAVSQLISNLKRRQLVDSTASDDDGRLQLIQLSTEGLALLCTIRPIWESILHTFVQMCDQNEAIAHLLPSITAMERLFAEKAFSERINNVHSTYTA